MDCENCHNRPAHRRGLCTACYRRWLQIRRADEKGPCSVEGCERPYWSAGYCQSHYQQVRYKGGVLSGPPMRAKKGDGHLNKDGYRLVTVDGVSRREHVLVMEEALGRELLPGETVHHRNGVRDDNRLENLEVWRRQPPGQRVPDLVEYLRQAGFEVTPATPGAHAIMM